MLRKHCSAELFLFLYLKIFSFSSQLFYRPAKFYIPEGLQLDESYLFQVYYIIRFYIQNEM